MEMMLIKSILGTKYFTNKDEMRRFSYPGPEELDEETVKQVIAKFLEQNGYSVTVGRKRERGPDLRADKSGSKLIAEVKGEGTLPAMFNNYFLNALGEILQRMRTDVAEYGIALPAHEKFVRLTYELPDVARQIIRLNFYFVEHVTDGDFNVMVLKWNVH
jgi:hypothetical protein